MKLNQLAAVTEVPVSSIKFYLRQGLLPPGEKLNATTARYGHAHRDRLELIKALRHVVGLSLEQIRHVTEAVAAKSVNHVDLMATVQTAVLNALDSRSSTAVEVAPVATPTTARDVVAAMGWPPGTPESMAALDRELTRMGTWGMAPHLTTALVYARAVDSVAAFQIQSTHRGAEDAPQQQEGAAVNRDRLARHVALGVYSDSQLLLRLLAVAQGAHAQLHVPHSERNP